MKKGGASGEPTKRAVPPVAQPLAELVASLAWDQLSESVRHEARRSFVNSVGATIAGSREPTVHKLMAALKPLMGPPRATVLGCAGLVDTLSAAFLNAVSGKVLDLADAHSATPIHPGATILASLLGLAESRRLSGSEVLTAFVAGCEVASGLAAHWARVNARIDRLLPHLMAWSEPLPQSENCWDSAKRRLATRCP